MKNLLQTLLFLLAFTSMVPQAFGQWQNYSNWQIDASNLTNGNLVMTVGQTKTITYSVTVSKAPSFTSFNFTLQRQPAGWSTCGCTTISGLASITPADFGASQTFITKTYTTSVTAAAGASYTGTTLRNGDKIILAVGTPSGNWSPSKEFLVTVVDPPIANNTISNSGASSFYDSGDPAILNGSTPTAGNGTYGYQWQSSTTSSTLGFSNITGATGKNFDPPAISQTTYYRRNVTSGTAAPSTSNFAKITIVRNGATFNNPINIGNIGLCTNYGNAVNVIPGDGYGNEQGNEFDDVFYKFNLTVACNLSLSNCKSDGVSGALYLLNASGTYVTGMDGQVCDVGSETIYSLQPGIYYVLSESTASYLTYLQMNIYIGGPSCRMASTKSKGSPPSHDLSFTKTIDPQPGNSSASLISIYPNPASQDIFLNLVNDGPAVIQVIDARGIAVKELVIQKSQTLNISDLPGGLYVVKINERNKWHSERLLVEK